jgi:DNA-binding transcriptional MerR regulator
MPAREPHGEGLVRISEAARQAKVSKQTIEYYILVGLLEPLRPDGSRSRYFDAALIKRIRLIRELNRTGIPLREIRDTYLQRG